MNIEIDGKDFHLPDTYSEITLDKFIRLSDFVEKNLPKEDAEEDIKAKFYFDYCSYFIPKDSLKKVNVLQGLLPTFNHLWQFSQMPTDSKEPAEILMIEKNVYKLCVKLSDKPLEDMTFEEYEESNAVLTALNKMKENKLGYLAHLLAIFYRPVDKSLRNLFKMKVSAYNSDHVEPRAELFRYSLDMQTVWNCYFFLLNRTMNSALNTVISSLKEMEKNHS